MADNDTPTNVIMSHAEASKPKGEWAKQLAAEATAKGSEEKKQGGIKDLAVGRQDMFRINPYSLQIRPDWNSRSPDDPENIAHIDWLARSIASEGVKKPLEVFWDNGKPVVEDGHCRLLAVFRAIEVYGAEIKAIPVQVTDRFRSEADRILSQIVSNSGKGLTPYEMSSVCSKLRRLGWSVDEIAKRTAKSNGYIEGLLQLQAAPEEVKKHVATGAVSATLAVKVLKAQGDGQAAVKVLGAAVDAAKAKGQDRATERHVRATTGVKQPAPKPVTPKVTAAPVVAKPTTAAPTSKGLDGASLVEARGILERAKWNDTPRLGQPVTCAMDADEYARLRDLLGF